MFVGPLFPKKKGRFGHVLLTGVGRHDTQGSERQDPSDMAQRSNWWYTNPSTAHFCRLRHDGAFAPYPGDGANEQFPPPKPWPEHLIGQAAE